MGVDKMGVRARIVVKDVAVGPKAKNPAIFSPTPCAESIKVAAHIFLSWDHGAGMESVRYALDAKKEKILPDM